MRKLLATTLLACGVAAVGITAAPAHAAATCNGLTVTITGTDGNDVRVGTPGNDVFAMGAGNDVVSGLDGNDTACMGTGDDQFFGGRGDDTFVAESVADGSDVFFGDDGAQSGHDTASYAARTTAVTVSLDDSANDGQAGEGDFIAGDDVDAVRGGSGADVLTENAPGRTLFGGPGNDRLNGASDMFGEAGADTLIHLAGGESAFLHGGDGADRLIDQANVKSSLDGDAGPDRISGGAGDDTLFGGAGDDRLLGGSGNEFISGDDGNDVISGGLGNDGTIGGNGDAGNDTYLAEAGPDGSDSFSGGAGNDTANYAARNNASRGTVLSLSASGFGNDGEPGEGDTTDAENLNGGTGRNIITGDARANRLEGGPTFDIITSVDGIGGNDVIIGHSGVGTDVCQGDAGPPPDSVHCP
jgi:Ca2+-binding RTX toxin-like protein